MYLKIIENIIWINLSPGGGACDMYRWLGMYVMVMDERGRGMALPAAYAINYRLGGVAGFAGFAEVPEHPKTYYSDYPLRIVFRMQFKFNTSITVSFSKIVLMTRYTRQSIRSTAHKRGCLLAKF